MQGLDLVVVIGGAILVGGLVARRLRVPPSLVLLVLGSALGFIPVLGGVELPSDLVLLLFLPVLLYWESLTTSLREIRRNLRVILLRAVVLVIATAAVVAVIAHAAGLSWPLALALGAIVAPTDPTAIASVAGRLPRRSVTILRAESLVNDGTAIVLYTVAVGAAVSGGEVPLGTASLSFATSYAGAIVIGLAVGFVVSRVRRVLSDRTLSNVLSVLTPFLAYLPAEAIGVSGVVAVVTCGLLLSQAGPRQLSAGARSQATGFWQLTTYIINGALFVLIGFELHRVTEGFGRGWLPMLAIALAIALAVVATRLLFTLGVPYAVALLRRRHPESGATPFRQRVPSAWAGFRGAVSLALALGLPAETAAGDPLPARELIITATFVVILFTLLVQGLTMPAVVRWARLPADPTELDEELLAEQATVQAVLDELPAAARRIDSDPDTVARVEREYRARLERIHRSEDDPAEARREEGELDRGIALRRELLPVGRDALVRLRDEGRIDDVVLRRVQRRLDLQELRLDEE